MNFDAFYGAFSSVAQAINNIGQSLSSLATIAEGTPTVSTTVTSIPTVYVGPYPTSGAEPFTASSGNVAAATATATITSSGALVVYIDGFIITSSGSTGAGVVSVTVTGVKGGTMTFTYSTLAGATVPNDPLVVNFPRPIPASGAGISIVVSMPSLGVGNTHASIVAYGYRI